MKKWQKFTKASKKIKKRLTNLNPHDIIESSREKENKNMTTIIIADGITATLTNRKAEQYRKAMEATAATQAAIQSVLWDENFDWSDWEEFWAEEWEAWERFFS